MICNPAYCYYNLNVWALCIVEGKNIGIVCDLMVHDATGLDMHHCNGLNGESICILRELEVMAYFLSSISQKNMHLLLNHSARFLAEKF